jgi:predicted flap endonuclease-1-like 5' DNA nuclease
MSEKQRLYGDTAGLTTFWLMAGFGSAMVAGHFMLRAMQRMQEAGGPNQMMKGPFGGLGWMFDATRPAETKAPAAAAPRKAKAKPEAEDAEIVAPKLRLVEAGEGTAETVEAASESLDDAAEAGVAAGERVAATVSEAMSESSEAVKAVAAEMTEATSEAAPAETAPEAPAEERAPEAAALAEMLEPETAYPGRPTALAAPVGEADDLKKIKGVGPKLESVLNGLGYYHFAQIASWGPEELAAVDESLDGFAGRATRDDWISQAKLLGEGGATEFSKRVEDGEIY